MSALTDPVTIEVGTNTHSIAVGAGVEWWRVKVTVHIISEMPVNIRNLPTSIPFLVLTSRTSRRSRIYFINSITTGSPEKTYNIVFILYCLVWLLLYTLDCHWSEQIACFEIQVFCQICVTNHGR